MSQHSVKQKANQWHQLTALRLYAYKEGAPDRMPEASPLYPHYMDTYENSCICHYGSPLQNYGNQNNNSSSQREMRPSSPPCEHLPYQSAHVYSGEQELACLWQLA